MWPIWRDNWLFLLLDEKNSRERNVPERLLVEPASYCAAHQVLSRPYGQYSTMAAVCSQNLCLAPTVASFFIVI